MIDLRQCKKGDKLKIQLIGETGELLRKNGIKDIVTYDGMCDKIHPSHLLFPHMIIYSDGSRGTRTHEGTTFKNKRLPDDPDVIEIIVDDE